MVKKIEQCENFGSPETIAKLIKNCNNKIRISDILEFFRKDIHMDFFYPEDTITLLIFLDLLKLEKDLITLTDSGKKFSLKNKVEFRDNFKNLLISKIFESDFIDEFLNVNDISYDYDEDRYVIKSSKIFLKYSALRNLLIKLGVLEIIKNTNLFIIHQPLPTRLKEKNRPLLSLKKLKESLLIKEKHGYEAENFVLKYEQSRLTGNPHMDKIKIISDLDVCAGYDIISFENTKSLKKIFIEVKSIAGNIDFFWSKNEVATSKIKEEDYYLYLVDRNKISEKGYTPLIIRNPYKTVFLNEKSWIKNASIWQVNKLNS